MPVAVPAIRAATARKTARRASFLSPSFAIIPPCASGFEADWHWPPRGSIHERLLLYIPVVHAIRQRQACDSGNRPIQPVLREYADEAGGKVRGGGVGCHSCLGRHVPSSIV